MDPSKAPMEGPSEKTISQVAEEDHAPSKLGGRRVRNKGKNALFGDTVAGGDLPGSTQTSRRRGGSGKSRRGRGIVPQRDVACRPASMCSTKSYKVPSGAASIASRCS